MMTDSAEETTPGVATSVGRVLRRIVMGAAAVGFIVLVGATAAVVAVAALAIAAILTFGVALAWLVGRLLGRKTREQDPDVDILVARRGPRGWTVDGAASR